MPFEETVSLLEINLLSAIYLTKLVLPDMLERHSGKVSLLKSKIYPLAFVLKSMYLAPEDCGHQLSFWKDRHTRRIVLLIKQIRHGKLFV